MTDQQSRHVAYVTTLCNKSSCTDVHYLVLYYVYWPILMKFGTKGLHIMPLGVCEFCAHSAQGKGRAAVVGKSDVTFTRESWHCLTFRNWRTRWWRLCTTSLCLALPTADGTCRLWMSRWVRVRGTDDVCCEMSCWQSSLEQSQQVGHEDDVHRSKGQSNYNVRVKLFLSIDLTIINSNIHNSSYPMYPPQPPWHVRYLVPTSFPTSPLYTVHIKSCITTF